MAVLWNFWLCKGWKHCQKHWRASRETLSKLSRMKRFLETAAKKNQCSCFRRFCGIMLEFQQKLLKLSICKPKLAVFVGSNSAAAYAWAAAEKNRILSEPPRCFMTIKMMPKDGVATAQIVFHFVCKPAVSLSCGIAWALVPRARRLESTGWPAGGQCPGPTLFRSKFIPGLREGVGHTSPSYNKVCPRLPVWKGWPKRARRVV